MQNCIYKLSNGDKTFIIMHFSKSQINNKYVPYFNRIDFVVIPCYIELPCLCDCNTFFIKLVDVF